MYGLSFIAAVESLNAREQAARPRPYGGRRLRRRRPLSLRAGAVATLFLAVALLDKLA
jgi:hypothetical protein